jgi:translation initiation factor IF-1
LKSPSFFNDKRIRRQPLTNDAPSPAKDKGFLRLNGSVIEALPAGMFKVQLENDHVILAHLSGKMRLHRLKILPGDTVTMEVSPYDLTKGRIVYRL